MSSVGGDGAWLKRARTSGTGGGNCPAPDCRPSLPSSHPVWWFHPRRAAIHKLQGQAKQVPLTGRWAVGCKERQVTTGLRQHRSSLEALAARWQR